MDKQLLKALDNLGEGLQALVEALQNKGEAKSDVGQALQAGDFEKSIQKISVELKSIKSDTQEILKNQKTLIGLAKKKEEDKKGGGKDPISDAGDTKKTGALKKGLATILLIAVAVLAIGLAFKIVGKVNVMSIIALGIGIVLVAFAFERVAKIKGASGGPITLKEAFISSLVMVTMSLAVMVSSKILSMISPVSIKQALTAAMIALLFVLVAPAIGKMIASLTTSTEVAYKGMNVKTQKLDMASFMAALIMVPLLMITSSIGIMLSSKILSMVTPLKMNQLITVALIALMFAVVAKGIAGLITAFTTSQEAKGKGYGFKTQSIGMGKMAAAVISLPLIMAAISVGILASSKILNMVTPISFMQAITAILIAGMFAVVSMGIGKLINSLGKFALAAIVVLPAAMAAIALGISLSAKVFAMNKKSFDALSWPTIFKILLLGVAIGAITFVMGYAIKNLKKFDMKTVVMLPMMLAAIATAVAASAFIFGQDMIVKSINKITFPMIFKIALLGIAIGIVTIIAAFAMKILGNINMKKVTQLPLLFTLLSTAIAVSAVIFSMVAPSFAKLSFGTLIKILVFGVVIAIVTVVMAIAIKIITKVVSAKDALKGGLVIVIIAGVIMVTSLILSVGSYTKFPPLKWVLGTAAAIGAFGIAAVLLGTQALNPLFYAGLGLILLVAGTILATSYILGAGSYSKFPTMKWLLNTSAAMGVFATAAILLGFNAINPFFYAGLGLLCLVAETIVEVSNILKGGKYNLPGLGTWAKSVAILYTLFTPLIITLGAVGAAAAVMEFFGGGNPFEKGRSMLNDIAYSIVDVSRILSSGSFKAGPPKAWAEGVSIAIGAFAPVYRMLVNSAIFEALGSSGVGPDDFAKGIRTVAMGITVAALYFARNKSAFLNGPPLAWAKGVSTAIGGFAPVFKVMQDFPFTAGKKIARAMRHVAYAIVEVASILSEAGSQGLYKPGTYPSKKWGQGVGESIGAFNKIFEYMFKESSWFGDSEEDVVDKMRYAMRQIAWGINDVAYAISGANYKSFPSKQWGKGIKEGIKSFLQIFDMIWSSGLSTGQFRDLAGRVADGARSMAMTAAVLYANRKAFSVKLEPNFIKNISTNIIGFAKLALQLDKMLVTEKTVTTTESSWYGSSSSSSRTVKERKDLTLPRDVAIQLVKVATIFWKNRKVFSYKLDPSWMRNLSSNLLGYVRLQQRLDQMTGSGLKAGLLMGLTAINPAAGLVFAGASALIESHSDDIVAKTSKKLVKVAKIIESGRKAFETKVDPFFMRKVGQNLIDFAHVVKRIAEIEEKSGTGTGFLNNLMGRDPISSYTRKMMTLAKGYDAMANALLKLGRAIKILKLKDLKDLARITSEVSSGRYNPEKRISPVQTKPLFAKKEEVKKTDYTPKFDEMISQLKGAIKVLQTISANSASINNFLKESGGEEQKVNDPWGRPPGDKWYNYDPVKKQFVK